MRHLILLFCCLSACTYGQTRDAEYDATLAEMLAQKPFQRHLHGRFEVYVYANSEGEREIAGLVPEREKLLKRAEEFFGRKLTAPITLFLYPSYEASHPFPSGRCSPAWRVVYAAYQEGSWSYEKQSAGHELVHLLSNTDDKGEVVSVVGLLDEGIAEYLSGFEVDPHLRLTDHMQAFGRAPFTQSIGAGNLDYRSPSLYPIAGSWVKFLVESQPEGRLKFLRLLKRTRLERGAKPDFATFQAELEATYGKSLDTLTGEWNEVLTDYWEQRYELPREHYRKLEESLTGAELPAPVSLRLFGLERFLTLVAELEDGRRFLVVALPDDSWRVVREVRRR